MRPPTPTPTTLTDAAKEKLIELRRLSKDTADFRQLSTQTLILYLSFFHLPSAIQNRNARTRTFGHLSIFQAVHSLELKV